jgi:hypothetical protein
MRVFIPVSDDWEAEPGAVAPPLVPYRTGLALWHEATIERGGTGQSAASPGVQCPGNVNGAPARSDSASPTPALSSST